MKKAVITILAAMFCLLAAIYCFNPGREHPQGATGR